MPSKKWIPYSLLCFFVALVYYHSVASPPPLGYFTTDENFISDSGVFMLYGNAIRNPDWPASINLWSSYMLIVVISLYDVVTDLSTSSSSLHEFLVSIDQTVYRYLYDRTPFIQKERIIQLIILSYIYHRIIKIIFERSNVIIPDSVRAVFVGVLISFSSLWIYAGVIRPDAIGAALFLLIILRIVLVGDLYKPDYFVMCILFSLVVSQRFLYVLFAPFIFGSIAFFMHKKKEKPILFFYCLGVSLMSFVAFLPHVYTNTLMVVKGLVGNVLAKNVGANQYFFNEEIALRAISNPLNWLFTILTVRGMIYFIDRYKVRFIAWLLVLNFVVICILIYHATVVTSSHTIVLEAMGTFFGAFGVLALHFDAEKLISRRAARAFVVSAAIVVLLVTLIEVTTFYKVMGQTTNFTDTVTWLKSLEKNRKVMLDYGEFDPFVYKNEATITREIDQFSDELFRQSKVKGMYSWQKEELPPLISMTSTFEDENLVLIQNRLLLRYFDADKRNALNVFYYLSMENIIACSVSEFEAFERFNNGEFDFLVYKGPIANLTPAFIFDKAIGLPYYVYAKNTGSAKM